MVALLIFLLLAAGFIALYESDSCGVQLIGLLLLLGGLSALLG